NADEACCDFGNTGVDDVGYLGGLIDEVKAAYPVGDVFVVGHSNGGYMAYRMACERADAISAIISLAGNAATTPANCQPSQPVSVLHLHGTADATVPFAGTAGASSSVQQWMSHDTCGTARTPDVPSLDLETSIVGAETTREHADGCPAGIGVELWAIEGGSHIPNFAATFGATLFQWLTDHAR
ncbi:MAG: hypothetical protein H0T79_09445, partial [Deltaproteobacteria bacterium]|nr:hypothetical protein [Deltaproteobacteria bacterium]